MNDTSRTSTGFIYYFMHLIHQKLWFAKVTLLYRLILSAWLDRKYCELLFLVLSMMIAVSRLRGNFCLYYWGICQKIRTEDPLTFPSVPSRSFHAAYRRRACEYPQNTWYGILQCRWCPRNCVTQLHRVVSWSATSLSRLELVLAGNRSSLVFYIWDEYIWYMYI